MREMGPHEASLKIGFPGLKTGIIPAVFHTLVTSPVSQTKLIWAKRHGLERFGKFCSTLLLKLSGPAALLRRLVRVVKLREREGCIESALLLG